MYTVTDCTHWLQHIYFICWTVNVYRNIKKHKSLYHPLLPWPILLKWGHIKLTCYTLVLKCIGMETKPFYYNYKSCLFEQDKLLWHLLLHFTFALKHLHRRFLHPLSLLQEHLKNPWPVPFEVVQAASLRLIDLLGISFKWTNFSRHGWNWFLLYSWFRTPEFVPIL